MLESCFDFTFVQEMIFSVLPCNLCQPAVALNFLPYIEKGSHDEGEKVEGGSSGTLVVGEREKAEGMELQLR